MMMLMALMVKGASLLVQLLESLGIVNADGVLTVWPT